LDQRQAVKDKEPRVEPLVLKRSVLQQKQRWSCKEELSFYRTLVAVGIQPSKDDDKTVAWDEFRQASKLDKTDEVLNEYYHAFVAMCKKIVGLPLLENEGKG
jgi:chromodomain-helicase-DNA-binding protein 6